MATTNFFIMTFEQFIRTIEEEWNRLKNEGSRASARFNSFRLNGVDGMPLTHQIGFGNHYRNGTLQGTINMQNLNIRTHARMGVVAAGVGATVASFSIHPIAGIIAGGLTGLAAHELYKDWKAGFEAANYLHYSYFAEFPPIRLNYARGPF